MKARDLDRVLDRLRTGGEKNRLLGCRPGRRRVQLLGKCDIALVGRHLKAGVRETLQLPEERRLDLRMQLPGIEHGDAACEVDETPSLDVPQLRVRTPIGINRERVRDATRYSGQAPLLQFAVVAHEKRIPTLSGYNDNDISRGSID